MIVANLLSPRKYTFEGTLRLELLRVGAMLVSIRNFGCGHWSVRYHV